LVKKIEGILGVKRAFISALILVHADSSKYFFLEVDTSGFVLSSVLF
jgi:hypothetical protein